MYIYDGRNTIFVPTGVRIGKPLGVFCLPAGSPAVRCISDGFTIPLNDDSRLLPA